MHINNIFFKRLFKIAIIFAILECVYLFAIPPILNYFISDDVLKNVAEKKTNSSVNYSQLNISTHIKPDITIFVKDLSIKDKENTYTFLISEELKIKISLLDLIRKKINIKNITAQNLNLYIFQDKDNLTNIEKLFPINNKTKLKPMIKNNSLKIKDYYITIEDKVLNKSFIATGNLEEASVKNKKIITIKTQGHCVNTNIKSDFDIDLSSTFPLSKQINSDLISGKCFIYNINLDIFAPFIKKFLDKNTKTLSGNIDYLQISTTKDARENQIAINSLVTDIIYDRQEWSNDAHINGECKISTYIKPLKDKITVKSLNLTAKNIDLKAYGNILFKEKLPEFDITAEVKNSRAEDIFAMLPQNITQKLGTIEKVKHYKVYGDVNGKADIKGKIPQPDIIGYVQGRNVHALDKSIHKLHKGTVDIKFDKRKLYMDIFVELFGGQNAKINGYTYMYRDGINNVNIKTTKNIDFPLAQKIIIPVSKAFNFMLGPIIEMNITSGKGHIDMNVQGSIDYINLNGFSEFKNAAFTYNGLYGKVERAAGRLDFKEDIIRFKSKQAFVKSNPLYVDGYVKINDHLDFNILSENVEAQDALEIINKSELLKDVKEGLAIFTKASNPIKLKTNITAKIVPVPYGQPPLPPDEAFEDMKVKGSVELFDNICYIDGFKIPIEHIQGIVDFTETIVDIKPINAISGTSPLIISGKVTNDLKTKIPDVDITITSNNVNLKDTIKFLTESYMYPDEYPNISSLYEIASKHDLYFKYKAKAIDFVTDKAYAVMNFINDNTDDPIKATSGKVILDKAVVTVDNVIAKFFDSELFVNGKVTNVDTINPLYNLEIKTNNFNLENLNDTSNISIMPKQMTDIFSMFKNYKGFADVNISLNDNILNGNIDLKSPQFIHDKTNIPLFFDDFTIVFENNKLLLENITANIDDIPFYANFTILDYYNNQNIDGFFTSKLTQNFISKYLPKEIAEKIKLKGDINFGAKILGTLNNLKIEPKLTLQKNADIAVENTNLGDINEKREIQSIISLSDNNLFIDNLKYTRYISSQNNKTYPIKFMDMSALIENTANKISAKEINIKTYKNMPARFLNTMLKTPILNQGTFNGELKFKENEVTKIPQIIGEINFSNINIPLFDTVIKRITISSDEQNINLKLFGFLSEEKITVQAKIKNDLSQKPQIEELNVYADKINKDKLFEIISNSHFAMNENNQIKNIDLAGLSITNGHLEVKELIVKNFISNNFQADFFIDENGIFSAKNISTQIGDGNMTGEMSYNINTTGFVGNFRLNNVDANYIAETLFEGKNQIFGNANGIVYVNTKGITEEERIKNLFGYVYFDISDGRMPKLGSLEYLLRASNVLKNGITGFTINSILELLNLVKTGYFSNIHGSCLIENGIAHDIEIYSKGENLSLYIHGNYDINKTHANMEILGKLSKKISTIFGTLGNTSLNTFFKLIPGISLLDFSRKNFIQDVEKIPSFTNGDYESRIFQAIIDGNINDSGYVKSFKWVK